MEGHQSLCEVDGAGAMRRGWKQRFWLQSVAFHREGQVVTPLGPHRVSRASAPACPTPAPSAHLLPSEKHQNCRYCCTRLRTEGQPSTSPSGKVLCVLLSWRIFSIEGPSTNCLTQGTYQKKK